MAGAPSLSSHLFVSYITPPSYLKPSPYIFYACQVGFSLFCFAAQNLASQSYVPSNYQGQILTLERNPGTSVVLVRGGNSDIVKMFGNVPQWQFSGVPTFRQCWYAPFWGGLNLEFAELQLFVNRKYSGQIVHCEGA